MSFSSGDQPQRERKERGQGSGVIVESNGLIITNNHVVNKADEIRVFLSDKREFKGKLIGTDTKTDIAIVKIEATGLSTIPWPIPTSWRSVNSCWPSEVRSG